MFPPAAGHYTSQPNASNMFVACKSAFLCKAPFVVPMKLFLDLAYLVPVGAPGTKDFRKVTVNVGKVDTVIGTVAIPHPDTRLVGETLFASFSTAYGVLCLVGHLLILVFLCS